HDPAHRERRPTRSPDLARHLIVGAADAPRADLDHRLHLIERAAEHPDRVLLGALADQIEGAVEDPLDDALLATRHHAVDELGDEPIVELGIGEDVPAFDFAFARHSDAPETTRRRALAPLPRRSSPTPHFGRFAPYLERLRRRSCTPIESSVPRMIW